MVTADARRGGLPAASGSRVPPVGIILVAALVLVLVGGVYVAGRIPQPVNVELPFGLLLGALVLVLVAALLLARLRHFAWRRFWQVAGWALAAYVVVAGMIEYAIVYDGTHGGVLALMTALLLVFAVDIPMLLGFSVARYETASTSPRPRT